MRRQNRIIYVNAATVVNYAKEVFGGNIGLSKSWFIRRHKGYKVEFKGV